MKDNDLAILEAQAARERARFEHALLDLKESLTPTILGDELIGPRKRQAAVALARQFRGNPLLFLCLAALVGFLLLHGRRARRIESATNQSRRSVARPLHLSQRRAKGA